MTLNPVFRDYIDNVLPDLGESNPVTVTWQEFLTKLHVPCGDNSQDYTDPESLELIRDGLLSLVPEEDDFFDVKQKEKLVLSKSDILSVVRHFDKFPMGVRLIQIASDELEQRAKNSLRNMDNDNGEESESAPGSEKAEDNLIENDFGGALSNIRHCSWVNVKHVAQRILGRDDITAAEWLYTKILLTGICDKNMRYVMVDEIQDYTMAQLQVLFKYYPNARFMLLGDEFQSIRRGTLTFGAIEDFAKSENKSFALLPLMTSYRCSPEITDKFASILPDAKKMLVSSVKRPGEKTFSKACSSDKEYYAELKKLIKEYSEMDGLTAVICRNPLSIDKIISALGKDAPSEITLQDALPESGAFLIELALAKGLEFDHVILADADADNYPDDEIGDHCLYTAMSRATQHLAVLAKGKLAEKA